MTLSLVPKSSRGVYTLSSKIEVLKFFGKIEH